VKVQWQKTKVRCKKVKVQKRILTKKLARKRFFARNNLSSAATSSKHAHDFFVLFLFRSGVQLIESPHKHLSFYIIFYFGFDRFAKNGSF